MNLPFKIAYCLLFGLLGFLPWLLLYQVMFYPEANWRLWGILIVCVGEIAVVSLLQFFSIALGKNK
jgi:hypothetical protein